MKHGFRKTMLAMAVATALPLAATASAGTLMSDISSAINASAGSSLAAQDNSPDKRAVGLSVAPGSASASQDPSADATTGRGANDRNSPDAGAASTDASKSVDAKDAGAAQSSEQGLGGMLGGNERGGGGGATGGHSGSGGAGGSSGGGGGDGGGHAGDGGADH